MISSCCGRGVWNTEASMRVCVGSAMDRSSSGLERERESSSSEDSCVLFSSEERMVDFPEDVVLPVVRLGG